VEGGVTKLKIPPSDATSQYPPPVGVAAMRRWLVETD